MPRACDDPGTEPVVGYPADNTSPINMNAKVKSVAKKNKKDLLKKFHQGMGAAGCTHGVDYVSFLRVQPTKLTPPNCSCMCGCS